MIGGVRHFSVDFTKVKVKKEVGRKEGFIYIASRAIDDDAPLTSDFTCMNMPKSSHDPKDHTDSESTNLSF